MLMNNKIKFGLLANTRELQQKRIYIQQSQLKAFWDSCSLIKMQQILAIKEQKLLEHIWHYFSYYLTNKPNKSLRDAYCVKSKDSDQILMYFYDCAIFKGNIGREYNQMFSSFIIRYKEQKRNGDQSIKYVHEFINPHLFDDFNMILKCKSSHLLKIYPLFKDLNLQPIKGDVVVLTQNYYYKFIYAWTTFAQNWDVEHMVNHLFKGLLILMQNQILLEFYKSMSQTQRQHRRFMKPVVIYKKPKLVQSYTMYEEEEGLGDVEWKSLKISGFKIKYRVVETQQRFECFRVRDCNLQQVREGEIEMSNEDLNIIEGFNREIMRWNNNYT